MEKIKIKQNINIWGWPVKTFPEGIGESFDRLIALLPDGMDRSYYGVSYMDGDKMIYHAAVEEGFAGEAEKYNCTRYTIDKGEYVAVTVKDWRRKTHTIKDVFSSMVSECPDLNQPAVEWYKNDDEMVCMVKIRPDINGFHRRS